MRWRRALRAGALGLLGLAGLGVAGLVFLATPPGNDLLRRVGIQAFNRSFPGAELGVDELRTRLLHGVTLKGVRLVDASGTPLVEVERLVLGWDLNGLLRRRVVVSELRLDRPVVDLGPGEAGSLRLLEALGLGGGPEPDGPPQAWQGLPGEVVVRSVAIRDGRLAWSGGAADHLNVDLRGRVSGSTVEVRELVVGADLSGPVEGPLALSGGLSLVGGDLAVDGLRARLLGSVLEVSGSVAAVETAPVLDLSMALPKVLAEDLAALVGESAPAADLSAVGRVEGPLSDLGLVAEVDAGPGGQLRAGLRADLAAERPGWAVDLLAEPLDLGALFPDQLTEPVSLAELQLSIGGSGLSWPDALAAHVELSADDAVLWGQPLPSLQAEGSLADGELVLHDLALTHAAGVVRASGKVRPREGRAALGVDADLPRLAALSEVAGTPLAGSLGWRPLVELSWGQALELRAGGPLRVSGLEVAEARIPRGAGTLALTYADGALGLDGTLQADGIRTRGVALGSTRASWTVTQAEQEGTRVVADLASAGLAVEGLRTTVDAVEGRVDLRLPPQGELALAADLAVQGMRPTGPEGSLVGSGPVRLALRGDALDAELALVSPDGAALVAGKVAGDLGEGGAWRINDLALQPVDGLRFEGEGEQRVQLGPKGLVQLDLSLSGPAGRLHATREAETGDLLVGGEGLQVEQLLRLRELVPAPPPAADDAPLQVRGEGALDLRLGWDEAGRPRALAGEATVTALEVPGVLEQVDLRVAVDGLLARPGLALDLSRTGGGARLVTARGEVPLDLDAGDLACGEPVALRLVVPPAEQAEARQHLPALPEGEGRFSADLRVSGDACDPDLRLVAAADGTLDGDSRAHRVDIELQRSAEQLQLRAFVEKGFRQILLVSGAARTGLAETLAALRAGKEVALDDPARWADQLQLSVVPLDLSLQDLSAFAAVPPGIEGRLVGGFQVIGSPVAPTVSGAAQLIGGRLGGVQVSSGLLVLLPAEGGYDVSLDLGLADPEDGAIGEFQPAPLRIAGYVPLDLAREGDVDYLAAEGLDLAVGGSVPLSVLEGLVDGVSEAIGAVGVNGRVSGSLAAPVVQASASAAGASLTYVPLGLVYEDIDLALRWAGQQVFLDTLALSSRKRFGVMPGRSRIGRKARTLRVSGQAVLDGMTPASVDGALAFDGFYLVADRDHEVALDGTLDIAGSWPELSVQGALVLDSSQLFFGEEVFIGDRSLEVDPAVRIHRTTTPTVARSEETEGPALWQYFDIDVGLDLLRNLRLRATVPLQSDYGEQFAQLSSVSLDAELGGQLRVLQRAQQLALQGEIETLRGTATVLGVPFDVRGGTISFLGDSYSNPLVDIEAVRRAGSYGDVTVHVSGFVDDLEIEPSSEEYPDKTDVVTLLLFGKPASEMNDSEGEVRSQAIAATLSVLTGSIEQAVGTAVVDELEIDPAGAVRVGWAVSDRIFLRLEQRFATQETENRTEVTLEYLISRRLYAEFTTGDRGASAANLYWRWRF